MTASQKVTRQQLELDGWRYLETRLARINNRIYTSIVMIRDGQLVIINSMGGFGGLSNSLAKQ